ncbi:hypothetical protein LINPERHAP2_LOCUS17002 [Linum perenne]
MPPRLSGMTWNLSWHVHISRLTKFWMFVDGSDCLDNGLKFGEGGN